MTQILGFIIENGDHALCIGMTKSRRDTYDPLYMNVCIHPFIGLVNYVLPRFVVPNKVNIKLLGSGLIGVCVSLTLVIWLVIHGKLLWVTEILLRMSVILLAISRILLIEPHILAITRILPINPCILCIIPGIWLIMLHWKINPIDCFIIFIFRY